MVMKHFVLLTLMAIMMLSSTLSADIHETVLLQVALSPSREVPIVTDRTASGNAVKIGYPLDSGNPNILWLGSRGLSVPVGDDRSIRRWVHGDCLLHKAVEEFSPAA